MIRVPPASIAHAFRRTALPLASYYAITLALPLANGAAQSGAAFAKHVLMVLVIPPLLIAFACTVHTMAHAWLPLRRQQQVKRPPAQRDPP